MTNNEPHDAVFNEITQKYRDEQTEKITQGAAVVDMETLMLFAFTEVDPDKIKELEKTMKKVMSGKSKDELKEMIMLLAGSRTHLLNQLADEINMEPRKLHSNIRLRRNME